MRETLEQLTRLPAAELHQEARTARSRLAESEWRMGVCLRAVELSGLARAQGFGSTVQYAVRTLALEAPKAAELLRAARELESLPLLSEAFRLGSLCWTKIREMTRVVCAATEAEWLAFALTHSVDEVRKQVVTSPREWKKRAQAANQAAAEVRARFDAERPETEAAADAQHQGTVEAAPAQPGSGAPGMGDTARATVAPAPGQTTPGQASQARPKAQPLPRPGHAPRFVRVILDFTVEEYVHWEKAEGRVRSRLGKRPRREQVALEMAQTTLDSASPRARARHQVILHVQAESELGWYETEKGLFSASAEVVEQALQEGEVSVVAEAAERTKSEQCCRGKIGRRQIPIATVRALFARAGGRCEVPGCRRGDPLHVHHRRPVSEGGGNDLESLELRCAGCHRVVHDPDFETRPTWKRARAARVRATGRKRGRGG